MSSDSSKESPKRSDESRERQLAQTPEKPLEPLASKEHEQEEAKTKLSQAANTKLPELVAMQGILDTTDADSKSAAKDAPGEPETKPIKTPADMYDRIVDSSLGQPEKKEQTMAFQLKAEVWAKPDNEEPVKTKKKAEPNAAEKLADSNKQSPVKDEIRVLDTTEMTKTATESTESKTEVKIAANTAVQSISLPDSLPTTSMLDNLQDSTVGPTDTTILTDMNNARVAAKTEKVALHITVSESNMSQAILPSVEIANEPTKKPSVKETLKPAVSKPIIEQQKERKLETEAIAKGGDALKKIPASGKAVDGDGKTIGYWFDGGRKLVMSVSIEATPQNENTSKPIENLKQSVSSAQIASVSPASFKKLTQDDPHIRQAKENFAPKTQPSAPIEEQKLSTRAIAPEPVVVNRQANDRQSNNRQYNERYVMALPDDKPAGIDYSTRLAQQKDVRETFQPRIASLEASKAVENITKSVARVQAHADTSNPLSVALVQKASVVQRDVHDVVSNQGAKQVVAMTSLEGSVKDYNKLVESNKATSAIADKLKISATDVEVLKKAFDVGRTENVAKSAEPTKLSTTVEGLFELRDQAHASLLKTIGLIEQIKDQTLVEGLFQTAMILSLATNRDLAAINYVDISAAVLNRALSDTSDIIGYVSSIDKTRGLDFTPERTSITASQEDRPGATSTSLAQAVRLDSTDDPIFAAIALNAGTAESNLAMVKAAEEREFQRRDVELFDWMKGKGFRVPLSPGKPPLAESTKVAAVYVPRIRGVGTDDARIVAPTFKPLSTLGGHTLTGQMRGLARVLGGFDAVSLAQYNHLMQLLQTTEEKAAARIASIQGVAPASSNALFSRYPFLGSDNQRRQSALAKPDSAVDFGSSYSQGASQATAMAQTTVVASATTQEPPAGPSTNQTGQTNQDEES